MLNKIQINELLDYYGALLTEKQQAICSYCFREDYSYQEIADLMGISRAAVYDTVKRCTEELNRYESILHLAAAYRERMQLYKQIASLTDDDKICQLLDKLKEIDIEGGNFD